MSHFKGDKLSNNSLSLRNILCQGSLGWILCSVYCWKRAYKEHLYLFISTGTTWPFKRHRPVFRPRYRLRTQESSGHSDAAVHSWHIVQACVPARCFVWEWECQKSWQMCEPTSQCILANIRRSQATSFFIWTCFDLAGQIKPVLKDSCRWVCFRKSPLTQMVEKSTVQWKHGWTASTSYSLERSERHWLFNKSHRLACVTQQGILVWNLSYFYTDQRHQNTNNNRTVPFSTCGEAAAALKHLGGRKASFFMSWKSRAIQTAMDPSEGWPIVSASARIRRPRLHLCCSWRYRWGSFGGLDPCNKQDFKPPHRHPLNRERLMPSTASLSAPGLETQARGNTGAFWCFSVSLSRKVCNSNNKLTRVHKCTGARMMATWVYVTTPHDYNHFQCPFVEDGGLLHITADLSLFSVSRKRIVLMM